MRARFLPVSSVRNGSRIRSAVDLVHPGAMVLLIGGAACLLLFWRLGEGSLEPSDEAIYGRIAREMVWSGDWLTPRWNYEVWFEKPPLMMWITAAFFRIFGVSEFWIRAASAACGVGTVIVTFLIATRLYGRAVGAVSVAVLATSEHFIWSARIGMMDAPLTLLMFVALYGYLRFKDPDCRRWYIVWTACGAAIMTKSAAAVIIPATIALALIIDRQVARTFQSIHFWAGAGLAALVAAPWHILMLVKHGQSFFYEYVTYHVFQRATTAAHGHTHGTYLVLQTLYEHFRPWVFLAVPALLLSATETARGLTRSRVLLLEVILVCALYTATTDSLPWYFMPIYPALAILIAAMVVEAIRSPMSFSFAAVFLGSVLAGPAAPKKFLLLVAPCCALVLVKRKTLNVLAGSCALFLIIVGAFEVRPLYQRTVDPAAVVAKAAERKSSADRAELLLFPESLWWSRQIVSFYSDRTIQQASTLADLKALLEDGRRLPIVLPDSEVADVARCCMIDVHTRSGYLVYGTLQLRHEASS